MARVDFELARSSLPKEQKSLNSLCLRWYDAVIEHPHLTGGAVYQLAWIIQKRLNKEKGYAWPSLETIVSAAGKCERTFQRAAQLLEEQELIAVERRKGYSNRYVINPFRLSSFIDAEAPVSTERDRGGAELITKHAQHRTPMSCTRQASESTPDIGVVQPGTSVSPNPRHACPAIIPNKYSTYSPTTAGGGELEGSGGRSGSMEEWCTNRESALKRLHQNHCFYGKVTQADHGFFNRLASEEAELGRLYDSKAVIDRLLAAARVIDSARRPSGDDETDQER